MMIATKLESHSMNWYSKEQKEVYKAENEDLNVRIVDHNAPNKSIFSF